MLTDTIHEPVLDSILELGVTGLLALAGLVASLREPRGKPRVFVVIVLTLGLLEMTGAFAATALAQAPPPGYSITQIGLSGSGYEYVYNGGIFRSGFPKTFNAGGQVAGISHRYNALGEHLGRDAWAYNGTNTQVISLTGSEYEYIQEGGGTYREAFAWSGWDTPGHDSGHVIGSSSRFGASGGYLGQDAWHYDGATTRLIGLTGSGYEHTTGGGTFRRGESGRINSAGQVSGTSFRYNASGGELGSDAWLHTGSTTQLIGLTGSGYEYAYGGTGGGTVRTGEPHQLNTGGQVTGHTTRRNALGGLLGVDAWHFSGTTTQLIGLAGSAYEYTYTGAGGGTYRSAQVLQLSDGGQATGYTTRCNAVGGIGVDAWQYNGTTTQQIGLTGSEYEYTFTGAGGGIYRVSSPTYLNSVGRVAGYSNRYQTLGLDRGRDAWLYDGKTTQRIGPTGNGYEYTVAAGGGTYRYGQVVDLNTAGQALGFSYRWNASGIQNLDWWLHTGSTTQLIGLTGSGYVNTYRGGRTPLPVYLSPTGEVLGRTQRINASRDALGQDAWLYNGTTTQLIGLTGAGYEYTYTFGGGGTYRFGMTVRLSDDGQAIGSANRYSAAGDDLGLAGWFFDDDTNITNALEFSFRSSDNYSYTSPFLLTEDGVVLGSYQLFSGTSDLGFRAFWWSADAGFYDLGGLVDGGLTSAGWQYLAAFYGSPYLSGPDGATPGGTQYLLGYGQMIGQTGGESIYLLKAIPEPTCGAIIMLLLARRLQARERKRRGTAHQARRHLPC